MKKILKLTALSLLTLALCGCEKIEPSDSKPTVDLIEKYQPLLAKGVYKLEQSAKTNIDATNFKLPTSITEGLSADEIKAAEEEVKADIEDMFDNDNSKGITAYSEGKFYSSEMGYFASYVKDSDDTDESNKNGDTVSYNYDLTGKVNMGFLTGEYDSDTGEYPHISFADNFTNPASKLTKKDLKESEDKKSFTFNDSKVSNDYINKVNMGDSEEGYEYDNVSFSEVNDTLNLSYSLDMNKMLEKNLTDGQKVDDVLFGMKISCSFTGVYDFSITEAFKDFKDIEEGKNKGLQDAFDKLMSAGTYKIHSKLTEPDKYDKTKVNVYNKDNIYRNTDTGFDAYASFGEEIKEDDGSVTPAENNGIAKFDDGKFRDFDFEIDSNNNISVNPNYIDEYILSDPEEFIPVYNYKDSDARIWNKNSDGSYSLIDGIDESDVEELYGALLADGEDKYAKDELSSLKLTVENSKLTKLTAEKRSGAKIEYTYTYDVENDFAKFEFKMPKLVSDEYIGYWVLEGNATLSDRYEKSGLTLDIDVGSEDGEKFLIFNLRTKDDDSYVYLDNEKYNEKENNITFSTTEEITKDPDQVEYHKFIWTATISDNKNSITLSYKDEEDETTFRSYTLVKTAKPTSNDDNVDDGE